MAVRARLLYVLFGMTAAVRTKMAPARVARSTKVAPTVSSKGGVVADWYYSSFSKHELLTAEQEVLLSRRVRAAMALAENPERLQQRHGHTDEWAEAAGVDAAEMRRVLIDGRDAYNRMFASNMRLVVSTVRPYAGASGSLSLEDLVQEGSFGLLKAVERFDPERGIRFSTFAAWWIRSSAQRAVAGKSRTIRLPYGKFLLLSKVKQMHAAMVLEQGRQPTEVELAERASMSRAQLRTLMPHWDCPTSLDSCRSRFSSERGAVTLLDSASTTDLTPRPSPTESVELDLVATALQQQLERLLSPLEADVIRLRYGLNDGDCLSWPEIAERLDASVKQAQQAKLRALRQLRKAAPVVQLRASCMDGDEWPIAAHPSRA